MASAADPAIAALRAVHDELAGRLRGYSDADLTRPSGATEWTVAQVLSHLGSGGEIARAGLDAALRDAPAPEQAAYQAIWDRWNAMSPREQADGALDSDEQTVAAYEALDDATRSSLQLRLPFLPSPVGVDLTAALRLNETTLHGWDVAAADDGLAAALEPTAVPVLVDAFSGPLAFLIGFLGKETGTAAVLGVRTTEPDRELTLRVGEGAGLEAGAPQDPTGTLQLTGEQLLRLLTGRLRSGGRDDAVELSGPLDLGAVRAAFPGF